MEISWKAGTQFPVKPQIAADTIKQLQRDLGKDFITAKDLLDASRDPNAPLHSCFEWDDSIAAEKFREHQSRHIIGSIVIKQSEDSEPSRLFINVKPVAPAVYGNFVSQSIVLKNRDYRQQVLGNALRELKAFQQKYSVYEELFGVCEAINKFADSIN